MAIDLNKLKLKVYEYVESRMTYIAPNLSVIVGASTAAKIMGNLYTYFFVYFFSTVTYIFYIFSRCSRRVDKFIKNASM